MLEKAEADPKVTKEQFLNMNAQAFSMLIRDDAEL
jgi:hypothetical protein